MHVLGTARTDVRVLREATALAQAGMDVTIVDIERERKRPREEELDGMHLRHIIMPSWFIPTRFKPWFLVKLARMLIHGTLELLRTQADVYHAHDDMALPACYIAARMHQKALIFDAHELPLVEPIITRWRMLSALSTLLLKIMMSRCSSIVTVSSPIMRELQRLYGGRTAIVIRNVPRYQAPSSSDRLRRHLGLSSDVHIALFQGNLDSRGLERLIPAARFMDPGIMLVMMGRGANEPELEKLIIREGVSDRVKIIPPVAYAELLSWTASADIGLVVYSPSYAPTLTPNIKMCLPNKLFEYLMAGLPVLASSLDAVAEVVKTYDVGRIVASHEPEEIGKAISAMLADREALIRMHSNALAACQRDLCWESESPRLIELYQNILLKEEHSMSGHVEAFDARRYWEERLQAHPDITGVGYLGRSTQFVEQQYRSRMLRIELALSQYKLAELEGRSVLDIGSGTGIWLDFWHRHGASSVAGLDFAQPSVDRLKAKFPDDLIEQADVSVAPLPLPDTMCFDVISAFDVLLHIVDPDDFRRTIANLSYHCKPGGWLIISDPIIQGRGYVPPPFKAVYSKVRSIAEYREVLESYGFAIDSIRPATVLLSDPLEAPDRLAFLALSAFAKVTGLWGRFNLLSSLIGPGAVKADQLACRFFSKGNAPGAKIIFARKRGR